MRTPRPIDDKLPAAATAPAREAAVPARQVASCGLRDSLTGAATAAHPAQAPRKSVAGFEPFSCQAGVVATNEQVNALRDSIGI